MRFFATTNEVLEALRVSDTTLRKWRNQGVFAPGIHYRAIGVGTKRPRYMWDLDAVEAAMAKATKRLAKA